MAKGKTLSDLDEELKASEKKAEEEAAAEAKAKAKAEAKPPKPAATKPGSNGPVSVAEASAPAAVAVRGLSRYDKIKHIMRDISPIAGPGWEGSPFVSPAEADKAMGDYFAQGWEIIRVRGMGYTAQGARILWVLGHLRDQAEGVFTRAKHITRNITPSGTEFASVSGFQADDFVSGYLQNDWELVALDLVGTNADGISMIWVLCR